MFDVDQRPAHSVCISQLFLAIVSELYSFCSFAGIIIDSYFFCGIDFSFPDWHDLACDISLGLGSLVHALAACVTFPWALLYINTKFHVRTASRLKLASNLPDLSLVSWVVWLLGFRITSLEFQGLTFFPLLVAFDPRGAVLRCSEAEPTGCLLKDGPL